MRDSLLYYMMIARLLLLRKAPICSELTKTWEKNFLSKRREREIIARYLANFKLASKSCVQVQTNANRNSVDKEEIKGSSVMTTITFT